MLGMARTKTVHDIKIFVLTRAHYHYNGLLVLMKIDCTGVHEIKFYNAKYLCKCSEFWAQRLSLSKTGAMFQRKRGKGFLHEAFVLVRSCSLAAITYS